MYTRRVRAAGFTLIELVVTMAIIGLLLATGVPAFRAYGRQVEFEQEVDTVAAAIRTAQTLSLAPEASKASEVTAYGVAVDAATNQVAVGRYSEEAALRQRSVVQTSTLGPTITIESAPSAPILFPIRSQGEPLLADPAGLRIVLTHRQLRTNNSRTIVVQAVTGQVSVE